MATDGTYRRLERIVKGFANHRRLQILDLLRREPELSVEEISERLGIGYVNASDHVRKLAIAKPRLEAQRGERRAAQAYAPRGNLF